MSDRAQLMHVLYYVSDLKQSIEFYQELLKFEVVDWLGSEAAFLRLPESEEYFDLGLVQVGQEACATKTRNREGAYHVGWRVDSLATFLRIYDQMAEQDRVVGLSDHATHYSTYISDPDQNEIEICLRVGTPPWRPEALTILPLDIQDLRALLARKELK